MSRAGAPVPADTDAAARRRDRVMGLLVVSVAFCLSLCISWWAELTSRHKQLDLPPSALTQGLVGYPSAVDPVQALSVARTVTRYRALRRMVAHSVQSNGTLDLTEGRAHAYYVFYGSAVAQSRAGAEGRGEAAGKYCPEQTVLLGRTGVVANPEQFDRRCPPVQAEPLPDPRCGPRELWRHALRRGAQANGLAQVEYYRSVAGPAWRFSLPAAGLSFSMYGDCERELDPQESQDLPR